MSYHLIHPLFPTGRILISPAAQALGVDLHRFIRRHYSGDWGETRPEDIDENREALESGDAILSQYRVTDPSGAVHTLVVMTEMDRTYTVLHLLDESLGEPSGE